jgi:hypothetical protein
MNEAGHFTQLLFFHQPDGVRQAPVAAADDQHVAAALRAYPASTIAK